MKPFLLLAPLAFLSFSFIPSNHFTKKDLLNIIDSGIIKHATDGSTSEWPANKFEQEKGTNTKYGVDNDSKNLYIAMIIPDVRTQIKIMAQGMTLYVDVKGKKREGKGILFPINKNGGSFFTKSGKENEKPDMKLIRSILGINLLSMQLFGFTGEEGKEQDLMLLSSANIQFSWDDNDIMYVEYGIPLSLFGDNTSLNQKTISLGWKLNDMAIESRTVSYTRTEVRAVPAGSLPPSNMPTRSGNSGIGNPPSQKNREQNFWTKYTISIPTK